jgi:hypothetical protein
MTIHFSPTFDTALNFRPDNRLGELFVGPRGLIDFISRKVGLAEKLPTSNERVLKLCSIIEKKTDSVFYQSFAIDKRGVALDILNLIDELALSGWDFETLDNEIPGRLKDLSQLAKDPEFPDGFAQLANKLIKSQITLSDKYLLKVYLSENSIHPTWKALIDKFSVNEYLKETHHTEIESNNSNLNHIAEMLSCNSKEKLNLEYDGSFKIIKTPSSLFAARYLTNLTSKEKLKNSLVVSSNSPLIFSSNTAYNLPAPQASGKSGADGITELFKFVKCLFKHPADPDELLHFFYLPNSPFPAGLKSVFINLILKYPGRDSEAWDKIVIDYIERKKNNQDQKDYIESENTFDQQLSELEEDSLNSTRNNEEFLVQTKIAADALLKATANLDSGALDKSIVIKVYQYILKWSNDKSKEQPLFQSSFLELNNFCKLMLKEIDVHEGTTITAEEIDNFTEIIYEPTSSFKYSQEIEGLRIIPDVANVIGKEECIIFFGLPSKNSIVNYFPGLTFSERKFLQKQNICYIFSKNWDIIKRNYAKAISLADKVIIIDFPPDAIEAHHPVLTYLKANIDSLSEFTFKIGYDLIIKNNNQPVSENSDIKVDTEAKEKIRFNKLEKITLNPDTVKLLNEIPDRIESYSSVKKMIKYPYQYFLEYYCKFYSRDYWYKNYFVLGNVSESIIYEALDKNDADLNSLIEDNLVKKASFLLKSGYFSEKDNFIKSQRNSVLKLKDFIKINNLIPLKNEAYQYSQDATIANIKLRVNADLVLVDKQTRIPKFLKDIKYAKKGFRKFSEMIYKGEDYQLILYSEAIKDTSSPLISAYFETRTESFVSRDEHLYPDWKSQVSKKTIKEVLDDIQNIFTNNLTEVKKGEIKIEENEYCSFSVFTGRLKPDNKYVRKASR